jgi:DNA-binding beta-propeller fold protein YncE
VRTIHGLAAPQGILYISATDRLFVANDKDGSVRIFDGTSFGLLKTVSCGDDADNLRYDNATGHIYVGYGSGALGELDQDGTRIADIKLDAHPESFQLEKSGTRVFVNLPDSVRIAVVDRKSRTVTGTWRTGGPLANFPMAFDENHHRLFVVCRLPARLIVLDTDHGNGITSMPGIGDCDDVFYDEKRHRIYAIGGEGAITVFQQQDPDHYNEIARIPTVNGARTGLFSPDLDKLYVAAQRHGSFPAEIRVYSLAP